MKRWQLWQARFLVLAVVIALTAGCGSLGTSNESTAAEDEQAIAEKEQKLAELKQQVDDMEKDVAESRQIAEMKQQIAQMEQALAEKREQASNRAAEQNAPADTSHQAAAPPPAPEVRRITLPEGTPIVVRTTTEISTDAVGTGDTFQANLEAPLMDGETLLAAKGARVVGLIANADKGGRVEGRAQLEVRLRSFVTDSGQVVQVTTNTVGMTAEKTTKKDALKVGIASGVGAAIGAIAGGGRGAAIGAGAGAGAGAGTVLLTRGDAAVLPSESVLNFKLSAPVEITEKP